MQVTPEKAAKIIYACAVLHNICINNSIEVESWADSDENQNPDDPGDVEIHDGIDERHGLLFREQYSATNFA